jgi:hypothetical protein
LGKHLLSFAKKRIADILLHIQGRFAGLLPDAWNIFPNLHEAKSKVKLSP